MIEQMDACSLTLLPINETQVGDVNLYPHQFDPCYYWTNLFENIN